MSDPIQDIADRLARVERELHALSTAPRAPNTSVRGGYIRFQPADGISDYPMLYAGSDASGLAVGMWVVDPAGSQDIALGVDNSGNDIFVVYNPASDAYSFALFDGRWHTPLISAPWQRDGNRTIDANGRAITASGTYTQMAATWMPCTSGAITTQIDVILGAGVTSAALRVTGRRFGHVHTPVVINETTGITSSQVVGGAVWAVPDTTASPSAEPIGFVLELFVEARVTGGAGNVAVLGRQPVLNYVEP